MGPTEQTDVQFVYDDADAITKEVLERYALTEHPRLREITTNFIAHMHAFAKESRLTFAEWQVAMEFLFKAGKACQDTRNEFIGLSDAIGLTMLVVTSSQPKPPNATAPTLVGPFFVANAPVFPNGADISHGAKGTPLFVKGRVLDTSGHPIAGARLGTWHSDEDGFYDVQGDLQNHGLWARGELTAEPDGRYWFRSVTPSPYPAPTDGALGDLFMNTTRRYWRPAHLHLAVAADGFDPLITHIFVRGSKYLDEDVAFGVRPSLIADFVEHGPGRAPDGTMMTQPFRTLEFDVVMTRGGK
jgi:hydroxyquinol 1,2-dioxygenase